MFSSELQVEWGRVRARRPAPSIAQILQGLQHDKVGWQ